MKSIKLAQLSANDAQVPGSLRGQSPRRSTSYLTYSDSFFVDLEAGTVESYEDQGQPSQDCNATSSHATFPCATASPTASPRDGTLNTKVFQKGVQDSKPQAHKSKLTNLEDIVSHDISVVPCSPAFMPTAPSQLPEKTLESNNATEDSLQSLLCNVDTKPITLEVSSVSVHSPKISSILTTPQKNPAFKNYKSPTVEGVLPEGRVQTPSHSHSHSHAETYAPSRPDKKRQAKGYRKTKQAPKDPGVKIQGLGENTKHTASNLPKSTATSLKRKATLSGLDEGLEGQKNGQKVKKAKKAGEPRFDLDEAMMDAPTSLPEVAANSPNPSHKRKSQSPEAEQVAQRQPKRAKKWHQTTGVEEDVMMDVDHAKSHTPTVAPNIPGATATSLKRGVVSPEAHGAAISSKTAKKPKQKHEGPLPIDVWVEFEDITQLVDARLREKEEKREEERKRREAPKILKRSRGEPAAAEAGKSAKKSKTAERAEEAETPELPKKRGRGSDDEAEKPKKKTKSKKD